MKAFIIILLSVIAFDFLIIFLHTIRDYIRYKNLEIGDRLCLDYGDIVGDTILPHDTTTIVSIKRDANDDIESITFENGVTITSFKEYMNSGWFLITD